jgi:protein involved in polysaccharide export with SLBB domain
VYEVSAVDRLTSLIEKAGNLKLPDPTDHFDPASEANYKEMTPAEQRRSREEAKVAREARPEASVRYITIRSVSGDVRYVDLQRYFATGNNDFNPVLSDGDAVIVPLVTRQTGVVNVFGAVKSPGEFEYLGGDKILTLIELSGGFMTDANTEDVIIVRFDDQVLSRTELHVNLSGANPINVDLKADDRIFVRRKPDYRKKYQVTVKGEVMFPGTYSIDHDKTRLSDIIAECGGLTDRANLYSARVIRLAMIDVEDPEYERLKALSVPDMTEMEYEYFKIRSREEAPPVVVNFERLIRQEDTSQDIVLQDKDEIDVPTLSPTVKVAGQVNSPGLIRYVPGENYYYYIQKAGGYSWNARKSMQRLIKAHSGTWMKPKKSTPIEIGDTIFVPEKQDVDWWELTKDLLLVASQVATVFIMVKSL